MMKTSFLVVFILLHFSNIFCDPIELSEIIIPEHTPIGHLLLTIHPSIAKEKYSYRFVNNNYREIQQYFSLNSSTGQLHIANDIDREKICTHRHNKCKFLLKIFELFNEKLYHIPILIDDINDHRPLFPYESSIIQLHISENSPPYQSKLFIQQAYDRDQIDNQKQLKYQLKTIDEAFPFRLETNIDISNRLALVLTQPLDREFIDTYNCTLHVTDTADHDEHLYITIIIDDVNDQSPIFESEIYSVELSENIPINTTILRVQAYDNDIGLNGEIIYDFIDASKQYANTFSLDKQTGHIRLRSSVDYEQRSSYIFYVQARDCGNEPRSSQTLVNITILDVNDCAPKISFRFLPEIIYTPSKFLVEISENYPMDKFFAQILVTDDDSDYRGQARLWFETIDAYKEKDLSFYLYQLDNSTYFFNRTKPFDFEIQQSHRLVFHAQDFDRKNPLETNQILTINVLDENDNHPKFSNAFYHLKLNENNLANTFLTQIEAFDPDSGENGRLTYEIETNDTSLPFYIDSNTGMLYCSKSLDREKRDQYDFQIIARDHGSPISLSSKISILIDVDDLNDHRPKFEYEKYEFSIEENSYPSKLIGIVRAYDLDLNTKLIYYIENDKQHRYPFYINQNGQLSLRSFIDREIQDLYVLNITVSDNYFKTTVPVIIKVLDINDCMPTWNKPSENNTILMINKDRITLGTSIVTIEAIDRDDKTNGNGFISYSIENIDPSNDEFLTLTNAGELILNSTPPIGRYRVLIKAEDNGELIQYSSLIQFYLLIGDNNTNGSIFFDLNNELHIFKLNSLSTTKRVFLLSTFFISIAIILAFIVCMILIVICRYRRQKYLYYIKCKAAQAGTNNSSPTMTIVENHLTTLDEKNSSSNSSKLSLENLHQKRLIDHSSSPSYTGANIYTQNHHHQISSTLKPTQATSDYYSNSSKHEEDVDEWTDDQQQQQQQKPIIDNNNEWSIEKILYPDWLYKNCSTATAATTITPRKNFNTSTFMDFNSYRTLETNGSTTSNSSNGRRTMSSSLTSNGQPSPKQVRFGCQQQIDEQTRSSYPHLSSTAIKQLRTGIKTTTILQDDAHDTFI
ncbi:unnamed protein product [Rotaria socialis]|uniref:Cadherin domain-containing protein n=1 Tax=Rotaria socialis TaxID=392032 RepID=A0A817U9A6_9BILA|nr:unnamed protein product [Rotaria socialis]CAF3356979.1 unnamed protein product [Rotaria socialis]CAF4426862.1 unnamed protein product [Rotaria socialis]